eukprot:13055169-Alexandrium_andersonii.AAC.1
MATRAPHMQLALASARRSLKFGEQLSATDCVAMDGAVNALMAAPEWHFRHAPLVALQGNAGAPAVGNPAPAPELRVRAAACHRALLSAIGLEASASWVVQFKVDGEAEPASPAFLAASSHWSHRLCICVHFQVDSPQRQVL